MSGLQSSRGLPHRKRQGTPSRKPEAAGSASRSPAEIQVIGPRTPPMPRKTSDLSASAPTVSENQFVLSAAAAEPSMWTRRSSASLSRSRSSSPLLSAIRTNSLHDVRRLADSDDDTDDGEDDDADDGDDLQNEDATSDESDEATIVAQRRINALLQHYRPETVPRYSRNTTAVSHSAPSSPMVEFSHLDQGAADDVGDDQDLPSTYRLRSETLPPHFSSSLPSMTPPVRRRESTGSGLAEVLTLVNRMDAPASTRGTADDRQQAAAARVRPPLHPGVVPVFQERMEQPQQPRHPGHPALAEHQRWSQGASPTMQYLYHYWSHMQHGGLGQTAATSGSQSQTADLPPVDGGGKPQSGVQPHVTVQSRDGTAPVSLYPLVDRSPVGSVQTTLQPDQRYLYVAYPYVDANGDVYNVMYPRFKRPPRAYRLGAHLPGKSSPPDTETATLPATSIPLAPQQRPPINLLYKTRLCLYYRRGLTCPNEGDCAFAHGVHEIRPFPPAPTESMAAAAAPPPPSFTSGGRHYTRSVSSPIPAPRALLIHETPAPTLPPRGLSVALMSSSPSISSASGFASASHQFSENESQLGAYNIAPPVNRRGPRAFTSMGSTAGPAGARTASSSSIPPSRQSGHGRVSRSYYNARYKTTMCRAYLQNKPCAYGELCDFAHGKDELRQPQAPRNWSNVPRSCKRREWPGHKASNTSLNSVSGATSAATASKVKPPTSPIIRPGHAR